MAVNESMLKQLGKDAMKEVLGTDEILNNTTQQKVLSSMISARIAQRVMIKLWSLHDPVEGELSRIIMKVPVKGDTRLIFFWRVLVKDEDGVMDINPLAYELYPYVVGSSMNFRLAEFLMDIERWEITRNYGTGWA